MTEYPFYDPPARPPGQHLMDTDVTYIVKGSATIITGGTVVEVNPHPAS